MRIEWFEGCKTPQEKAFRKQQIRENSLLLDIVRKFLTKELSKIQENRVSIDDYSIPNWEFKQIDFNAQERVLRSLLSFIDTKDN